MAEDVPGLTIYGTGSVKRFNLKAFRDSWFIFDDKTGNYLKARGLADAERLLQDANGPALRVPTGAWFKHPEQA